MRGTDARSGRLATAVLAAVALAMALAAAASAQDRPGPPRAGWTAASEVVVTKASSYCWRGAAEGDEMVIGLCVDGVPPRCDARDPDEAEGDDPEVAPPLPKGLRPVRLRVPDDRRVAVHVVLGFVPDRVTVRLDDGEGGETTLRPPVRRRVSFRVPPDFAGAVSVFAISRDDRPGGDALYAACLERRAPAPAPE